MCYSPGHQKQSIEVGIQESQPSGMACLYGLPYVYVPSLMH